MEIQLQELIEEIKKNGVSVAEQEASNIIHSAKEQAEKILEDAKEQAEKMIRDAKEENQRTVKVSEDAIRQAGRNLLISFRESVGRELTKLVEQEVNEIYSAHLSEVIIKVIENWSKAFESNDLTIILNSDDEKALSGNLIKALKEKMKGGITIKANDNFDGGFRILLDNGNAYYDYSKEAVIDMLSNYLNPKVTSLLKEADSI